MHTPQTILFAFLGGIIPALLWLWFWLKEEDKKEPKQVLTAIFVLGMLSVMFVIPIQKYIQANIINENLQLILWASTEELIKYFVVFVLIYHTRYINKPLDWPIYMITSALGFAALENTFFLLEPFSLGDTTVGLLTGSLRFLGSTLLHSIVSAVLGIAIALSFYMNFFAKKIYLFFGIILATVLHSIFNFFIINTEGSNVIQIFAFLWVFTIIVMLLFEKVRRMSGEY